MVKVDRCIFCELEILKLIFWKNRGRLSIGVAQTSIQCSSAPNTRAVGKCTRVVVPNLPKCGKLFLEIHECFFWKIQYIDLLGLHAYTNHLLTHLRLDTLERFNLTCLTIPNFSRKIQNLNLGLLGDLHPFNKVKENLLMQLEIAASWMLIKL